jgi:hypothetical protein
VPEGAALLALLLTTTGCSPEATVAPAAANPEREDRRLAGLLAGCPQGGFYDRDLSDLVPVLLEKLARARPDPLKRAKEELGLLGARAFPGLGQLFHACYSDQMRSALLENVVDALSFNPSDDAHTLLLEALEHPQESVRTKALDGLARLAQPQDFELIVGRLSLESRELRRQSVAVLFQADQERAEALFLDFFAQGAERDLWAFAAPRLAGTKSAESARRCAEIFPGFDPQLAPFLAAAAAREGHAEALQFLRGELKVDAVQQRLVAMQALQSAGLVDELGPALLGDPSREARAIAAAALGEAEPSAERRSWLRAALSDPDPVVRSTALIGLCAQRDEEGLAHAIAALDGEVGVLQPALQALREPLRSDPDLARLAFGRLLQRHALEEHRPVQQRAATFKAIGQMPLAEAAELLHRLGVEAGEEHIESLRAHDWLMIQAANTDVVGRSALAKELLQEDDALRRLDLIDAVGAARDDLARETLLEVAEHAARSPFERLFAASCLVKIGASWEVAPRLKRVAFSMQAPNEIEARVGLQCLLWQWY